MRALLLSTVLAAAPAWASGLDVPAIGSAFSGPSTADAAALYWNPARLSGLDTHQLQLCSGLVAGQVSYTRNRLGTYQSADTLQFNDPLDPAYVDGAKSGEDDPVRAYPVSPWVNSFYAHRLTEDLTVGLGLTVPYAAPLSFPDDGPQRYALQRAFIVVSQLTAGGSLELTPALSVGSTVSYVSGIGSLSRVQDFAGLDDFGDGLAQPPISQPNSFGSDAPSSMRELDVLSRPFTFTDSLAHGVDFSVGVSLTPTDRLTVGLTYHHGARMNFQGDFALDMDDDFFTQDLTSQGVEFVPLVTGDGVLSFRLPGRVIAGTQVGLSDKVTLDLEAHWVWWRQLTSFDITLTSPDLAQPTLGIGETIESSIARDWQDSLHAEVGLILTPKPDKAAFIGVLGVHTPASPESTIDVASPDGLRLVAAGGARLPLGERLTFTPDTEVQIVLPRTVTQSNYDLANGRYSLILGSIGGHLQWALGG